MAWHPAQRLGITLRNEIWFARLSSEIELIWLKLEIRGLESELKHLDALGPGDNLQTILRRSHPGDRLQWGISDGEKLQASPKLCQRSLQIT